MLDCDDWLVKQCVFEYFDNIWGLYICDRFVDLNNSKCKSFNFKYWCRGLSVIDVFLQVWINYLNWVVFLLMLIFKVVRKIEKEKCNCILVILEWKLVFFWVMLIDMKGNFNIYVKIYFKMYNVYVICRGMGNNGIFGKRNLVFNMIFLKIEF